VFNAKFTAAMGGIGLALLPGGPSPSSPPQEGARATVHPPHFFQVAGGLSPSLMAGATGDGKPLPDVKGFAVNPRPFSGVSWPAVDERRAASAPLKPPGKGGKPRTRRARMKRRATTGRT